MKKYLFIIILVFFAFQSCQHDGHKVSKQPNVVFIITDDQQLQTFGFLENRALTPRIDGLAGEGLYFSEAYVASSVCTPSRYTCLTGQYASRCRTQRFLSAYSEEGVSQIAWNLGMVEGQRLVPGSIKRSRISNRICGQMAYWRYIGPLETCTTRQ